MRKLLYVKSGPFKVDIKKYNVQILGLCRELIKIGYSCDIMFIDDYDHDEELENCPDTGCAIRILYRKGIKIFYTGIYPSILKKKFLARYDIVIATEYNQVMSPLLSLLHNNVNIYSGPYYSTFKRPFLSPIYDFFFRGIINRNVKHIIVKSNMAKEYLDKKGYKKPEVVGVALDVKRFEDTSCPGEASKDVIKVLKTYPCLLAVGTIIARKNILFLLEVFKKIKDRHPELHMVLIGGNNTEYYKKCIDYLEVCGIDGDVHWFCGISNSDMKFIYPEARVSMLASTQEIFGMVLLEAMYLGCPVVSALNGGSSTVIQDDTQGIVIDRLDADIWAREICGLLDDDDRRKNMIVNARRRITENFLWENLAKKMMDIIDQK